MVSWHPVQFADAACKAVLDRNQNRMISLGLDEGELLTNLILKYYWQQGRIQHTGCIGTPVFFFEKNKVRACLDDVILESCGFIHTYIYNYT